MIERWSVASPIDGFVNPVSGSEIDIVSTFHVGRPDYYDNLRAHIMRRQEQGFLVHYEEIGETAELDRGTGLLARAKNKVFGARIEQEASVYELVEKASSYTFQGSTALFCSEGSENFDVTEEHLAKSMSLYTHVRGYLDAKKLTGRLQKAAQNGTECLDESIFGTISQDYFKALKDDGATSQEDETLIHMRNDTALDGVDQALRDDKSAKLVLIWGLGHLAGLRSGLIERDYQHAEHREVVVATSKRRLAQNYLDFSVA